MFDCNDAWLKYPQHHIWFNKLWLAEQLGYDCGPASVPVSKSGKYIVRPIYNLRGMGLGTYVTELHPNTVDDIQPGYFWCEYFEGTHKTVFDLIVQFVSKHNKLLAADKGSIFSRA
mgnify:CR=1 FL=1